MPSSRGCRSSYDCIVKIKGVTTRPILFSQLMRSDGEGAMNPEELFADDRTPASEQERVHEDELHSLMRNILDWAISFCKRDVMAPDRSDDWLVEEGALSGNIWPTALLGCGIRRRNREGQFDARNDMRGHRTERVREDYIPQRYEQGARQCG